MYVQRNIEMIWLHYYQHRSYYYNYEAKQTGRPLSGETH